MKKTPRLNINPITMEELERPFNSLILIEIPREISASPKSVETS